MSDKDLAIMTEVKNLLCQHDFEVDIVDEDDKEGLIRARRRRYKAVFTMLRGEEAKEILKNFEYRDIPTINSSFGITSAQRWIVTAILDDNQIPMPKFFRLNGANSFHQDYLIPLMHQRFHPPFWIKKGEGWAEHKEDVSFAATMEEAIEKISRIHQRYPEGTVFLVEHLKGDLIKFYGVQGTDFFFWKYPDLNNSKFGLEAINGLPARFKFDEMKLKQLCDHISELTDIVVYGGDCIVDADGSFRIIDFNDWPSFSACRQNAAQAITERILKEVQSI